MKTEAYSELPSKLMEANMTYARLRSLTETPEDALGGVFKQVAAELPDSAGTVQFRVVGDGEARYWSASAGSEARAAKADDPALEIVATGETYRRMADGSYSPLEAFLDGKMRVRGDVDLGKRLVRKLSQPGGIVDIC